MDREPEGLGPAARGHHRPKRLEPEHAADQATGNPFTDSQISAYLGLDRTTYDYEEWRGLMRAEKEHSARWYVQVLDVLEMAFKRQLLGPDDFIRRAGIMVQVADTMDGVITIDTNVQRIDPVGYATLGGWKELIRKRTSAIELAQEAAR